MGISGPKVSFVGKNSQPISVAYGKIHAHVNVIDVHLILAISAALAHLTGT
jgi:hypothetical protein